MNRKFLPPGCPWAANRWKNIIFFFLKLLLKHIEILKFPNIHFVSNFMCLLDYENIYIWGHRTHLCGFCSSFSENLVSWFLSISPNFFTLCSQNFFPIKIFSVWHSISKMTFELFVGWKLNSLDTDFFFGWKININQYFCWKPSLENGFKIHKSKFFKLKFKFS